ncbi:NlpC/P60 family protein [Streptomyces sp. NPDC048362]|uniref:C40 family peptidase n=1 Tax=Streptomyces sp. NPDC048362 TaxID=3365539 RepID=UPI00371059CA
MAPENRDEVRQRIDYLYDQAESATGNFNATRALAAQTRSRGVPLAKRRGGRSDPALDEVARQWFDLARTRFGPTVPAVLPADRLPDGPSAPARPGRRVEGGLPGDARPPLGLPRGGRDDDTVLPGGFTEGELPALEPGPVRQPAELERGSGQPVAELTAGSATAPAARPLPTLESGRPAPANTWGSEFRPPVGELTGFVAGEPVGLGVFPSMPELPGLSMTETTATGFGETAVLPVAAPPVARARSARMPRGLPGSAAHGAPLPATAKSGTRYRLDAARDLLSRYAARLALTSTGGQYTLDRTAWESGARQVVAQPPAQPATAPAQQWTQPVQQWQPAEQRQPAEPVRQWQPVEQWQRTQWTALDESPMTPMTSAPVIPHIGAPIATAPTDTGSFVSPATTAGPSPFLPAPATESPRALRAAKAIAFARAQIGKPCVWGATGPDSYDCSSLTQAAWKAAGVTLPRAAHQQALAGAPVSLAGIEPGDLLLFFDDDRHVGLYVGDGMMVHAPGPGSSIREESVYGAGEAAIHRLVRPA